MDFCCTLLSGQGSNCDSTFRLSINQLLIKYIRFISISHLCGSVGRVEHLGVIINTSMTELDTFRNTGDWRAILRDNRNTLVTKVYSYLTVLRDTG